jgi:hypothetical protein
MVQQSTLLQQSKLSRDEWNGIEVPLPDTERKILSMIVRCAGNVNAKASTCPSLLTYARIEESQPAHEHLYGHFLREKLMLAFALNGWQPSHVDGKLAASLKKADIIRVNNTTKQLGDGDKCIVEFIIIDAISTLSHSSVNTGPWYRAIYALNVILARGVPRLNTMLVKHVAEFLTAMDAAVDVELAFASASAFLLDNSYAERVRMLELHDHQKELFTLTARDGPKLITLRAPTGTGKTISPIGLLSTHRVIFICAARHVGLSLARAAITMGKKIAFAFGCSSAGDIRLHYSAAKECIRDTRSGGIRKVDNAIGDNVELMISDLKSALPAIYYMKAFNNPEKLLLYWDEPTISLDMEEHPFHETIHNVWAKNVVPSIVLSSATLPSEANMRSVISDYQDRFGGAVHHILGVDCDRSVGILSPDCKYVLPHLVWKTHDEFRAGVRHMMGNISLLRYVALEDCVRCITLLTSMGLLREPRSISNTFARLGDFSVRSIKEHYLHTLADVNQFAFDKLRPRLSELSRSHRPYTAQLTTVDAHTLTNAPTIYLAKDVTKVGRFLLQDSKIPRAALADVYTSISHNEKILIEIAKLEKQQADETKEAQQGERQMAKEKEDTSQSARMIRQLRSMLQSAQLHDMFVPNTKSHLETWTARGTTPQDANRPFCCNISQKETLEILSLGETDDVWKLLLLMGVGVLDNGMEARYTEKMKQLAQEQKLFLLIAGSDYIYGTNYQFGHAFLGKDLKGLTQDKAIQSIGRVGRTGATRDYTVRLRDGDVGHLLFNKSDDQPEVVNMAKLFSGE